MHDHEAISLEEPKIVWQKQCGQELAVFSPFPYSIALEVGHQLFFQYIVETETISSVQR